MIDLPYDHFLCGRRCRARKATRQQRRETKVAQARAHVEQVQQQNALQQQLAAQLAAPEPVPEQENRRQVPLIAGGLLGLLLIAFVLKRTLN